MDLHVFPIPVPPSPLPLHLIPLGVPSAPVSCIQPGKNVTFELWCWEDSWESLGLQGDQTSQYWRKLVLNINWKDWCWNWNSNTLATWCEELTHWKRPWCWERLKAGGEWVDREWDGWMASPTWWTWVWASSGSWWRTGKPGMLQSMGLKELDTIERLNWTDYISYKYRI